MSDVQLVSANFYLMASITLFLVNFNYLQAFFEVQDKSFRLTKDQRDGILPLMQHWSIACMPCMRCRRFTSNDMPVCCDGGIQ